MPRYERSKVKGDARLYDTNWGGAAGGITGTAPSVDDEIATWEGTAADTLKSSGVSIDPTTKTILLPDLAGIQWINASGPYAVWDASGALLYIDVSGTSLGSGTLLCATNGSWTIGPVSGSGDLGFGDSTLRVIYPIVAEKGDLGTAANNFNDSYTKRVYAKAGASTVFGRVPCTIYQTTTDGGNTGAGEDDLWNQSIAASVLGTDGDSLRCVLDGITAATANTKRIRVYFGATTVFDSTAQIINNQPWTIDGYIVRTGAATQKAAFRIVTSAMTLWTFVTYSTPAETLSGAVTFRITGESGGAATDDIILKMGRIIYEPAP